MTKVIYEIKKLSRTYRILVEEYPEHTILTAEYRNRREKEWRSMRLFHHGDSFWRFEIPRKVWLERLRGVYQKRLNLAIKFAKMSIERNWKEYLRDTPIKKYVTHKITKTAERKWGLTLESER